MKSLQVAVITGAARGTGSAIAPAMTPLRRLGEPEDIAAAAVLFCSEDARWITGECIRVSGGLV
jgi:3-oxoacyl-[acyl-carrier protein] reductase